MGLPFNHFECVKFPTEILERRKGLFLLDAITKGGNSIYRFDMLHIEFAPSSKHIGNAHLKGDRRFVNVLYSDLVQINQKFQTNKYRRRFNSAKEVIDYSIQNVLYDVETNTPRSKQVCAHFPKYFNGRTSHQRLLN